MNAHTSADAWQQHATDRTAPLRVSPDQAVRSPAALERLERVAEVAGLRRAPGRHRRRVEVDDHVTAAQPGQSIRLTIVTYWL